MPTSLDVTERSDSPTDKKLLVFVAMQGVSAKTAKQQKTAGEEEKGKGRGEIKTQTAAAMNEAAYISVVEFDQLNGFKAREAHLIRTPRPQIVKLIYDAKCGLIVGCFRGYIEVYDSSAYTPKWKWDNDLKAVASGERRKKDRAAEERKKDLAFDTTLTDGLATAGVGGGQGKHTSHSAFSLHDLEAASKKGAHRGDSPD